MCIPGGFSGLIHWKNYNPNWKKKLGFRNLFWQILVIYEMNFYCMFFKQILLFDEFSSTQQFEPLKTNYKDFESFKTFDTNCKSFQLILKHLISDQVLILTEIFVVSIKSFYMLESFRNNCKTTNPNNPFYSNTYFLLGSWSITAGIHLDTDPVHPGQPGNDELTVFSSLAVYEIMSWGIFWSTM